MISTELQEYYYSVLKERLSEKRYIHSLAVRDEAVKLAKKYKANIDKCYVAGLLHDVCKEIPFDEMQEMVLNYWQDVSEVELNEKSLWHAIAGASYVALTLKVTDKEVLSAIRFHTMGKRNMTQVEKIVFLADYISADREYEDVSRLRLLAYSDLNRAVMEAVGYTVSQLASENKIIPYSTYECYNQLATYFKSKGLD